MLAAVAGALAAAGVLVLLRGMFAPKADLHTVLAAFDDLDQIRVVHTQTNRERLALTMLETLSGSRMDDIYADTAVTDTPLEKFAMDKAKSGLAGGVLVAGGGSVLGIVSSPLTLLIAFAVGMAGGYMLPDIELKKNAAARRSEFSKTLTPFITLLGSAIASGGGLTTATTNAAALGSGWVFVAMRRTLEEARLAGTSVWVAFETLGRDLRVNELIELAGSLTLAGNNGARITETIHSRAESARAKELSDARSEAEAKSSNLGAPVALVLLAWVGFLGFAAISAMAGST